MGLNTQRNITGSVAFILLALFSGATSNAPVAAGPPIVKVDFGTLGGTQTIPFAMNANIQVVGVSNTRDELQHAFSWTPSQGMVDLGTFGGSTSAARAVNDSGQVVGESDMPGEAASHAFLWESARVWSISAH